MKLFEQAVQALTDSGADFVLIGGVGGNLMGTARVQCDIDFCYSSAPGNREKIFESLPAGSNSGNVNLFEIVEGVGTFEDVKDKSVLVTAYQRTFHTLDLPGLIAAKRATGRSKDLEALHELESLLEAQEPE